MNKLAKLTTTLAGLSTDERNLVYSLTKALITQPTVKAKKVGRPKAAKAEAPKRIGRPKGSKNKPKATVGEVKFAVA